MTFPSPTFQDTTVLGVLTVPTAAPGTSTTQAASTAFVMGAAPAEFASPPPIGSTTPNTGAFTTLSATSTISGAGFTAWAASPPSIGSTAPGTGGFTALAASGAVTGVGFTARFATPGPIGNTVASTGAFTTLAASSTVSGAGFDAYIALGTKPASFTTLAASSTVSGAGFDAYLASGKPGSFSTLAASGAVSGAGFTARFASPGPIGNTAPSTGAFTTLTVTTNSASSQKQVTTPTAPASTTVFTMQGLAGSITPATTGSLFVTISGIVNSSSNTAGDGILYQIAYGTGAAPTNGAAVTGTNPGAIQEYANPATVIGVDVAIPFSISAVITGLSVATTYWVDLSAKSVTTVSATFLRNVSVSVIEVR